MATATKVELAVKMTCQACEKDIRQSLKGVEGIQHVDIDLANERVVVSTTLPSSRIQSLIESTGRPVLVRGQGAITAASVGARHMGAAVAILLGQKGVMGLARLTQVAEDQCIVEGTVDGLTPGKHGLHIHEFGDISAGCESVGDHFNPYNKPHGSPETESRHVGDLGNVTANSTGRAVFRIEDQAVKVWDVIGRSIVIDGEEDNFAPAFKSLHRVACGIIARSAGVFENDKVVCACSGKTMWQEKEELKQSAQTPVTSVL